MVFVILRYIYKLFKDVNMKRNLLEKYEDSNVLRSLVNLIPTIGGTLDILLSIKGSKWREERLKEFLTDLDKRVSEVENNEIIENISKSEEFYDLIVQSMNSVIKTRHKTKIQCYSNILINSLIKPKTKISSEFFISVLDTITIDEIEYLTELRNSSDEIVVDFIEGKKVIWSKYKRYLEQTGKEHIPSDSIFVFDIDLIWKLLSDKNLITIETKNDFNYLDYTYSTTNTSLSSSVTSASKIKYKISPFGKEFISWVLS